MATTAGPWHAWFAWHPVETVYHGWKWLVVVERRREWAEDYAIFDQSYGKWVWNYRKREKP